ncbi:MAG: peptidoglycan DD-metalloendopeptidase family protein [Gemmatimonadetes bacterium]|nr:peptidoglycan DD-metalloendopeptidase family protein [Gemmatimonadota bacterium]
MDLSYILNGPARRFRRAPWWILAVAVMTAAAAETVRAQNPPAAPDRIRQQREELDRIRRERNDIESRMRALSSTVHDLSEERTNLDRQADATQRVVRTLDRQILSLADEEADATTQLVQAQDELRVKEAILRYRVREIYKRGGMYTLEAMLSARSFGELLARYKYLHLVALRDRALVTRVAALGDLIAVQRTSLVKLRNDTEQSRQEKADEQLRLRALEQRRGRSLAQAESQQKQVQARLAAIVRDEARVTALIATLDAARRRADAAPGAAAPAATTLRTSDLGRLDWPVDGPLLYQYGRQRNANNTVIRWNGIGISAPTGTPVKTISSGTIIHAAQFGTYGLMVIVDHGEGNFSLYGSLDRAMVAQGDAVTTGQVIGTVGMSDPDLEPHLHLEIRPNQHHVNPADWLRKRR